MYAKKNFDVSLSQDNSAVSLQITHAVVCSPIESL